MSTCRTLAVVGTAVAVMGLSACGAFASPQEKGRAACDISVAANFGDPDSVEFVRRDFDEWHAKPDGWIFVGAVHWTPHFQPAGAGLEVQTWTYGCLTDKDGERVISVEKQQMGVSALDLP
jgi:hypothetical protein